MRWDEAQGRYVRSESDYGGLDPSAIRSVLSEIGGDAKSLFVDPVVPMIEGMQPRSPEENEKFLTENYPELGRDIQSRIAKTGVGARIGEQPERRPAGYWQADPNQGRGLNAVREDAAMGVLGLSELTPAGMAAPVLGGVVKKLPYKETGALAQAGLNRLNEFANRMKGGWARGKNIQGTPAGTRPQDILQRQEQVHQLVGEGQAAWPWYKRMSDVWKKYIPETKRPWVTGVQSSSSGGTPVAKNLDYTLTALAQKELGKPVHVGRWPSQTAGRFQNVPIDVGEKAVEGILGTANKWRNFFKNNFGDFNSVTNDRYMGRLGGFHNDSLSNRQYEYLEEMIKDTADQFQIKPAEAQAGAWSAFKARWDAVGPRNQQLAVKRGWWDEVNDDVFPEYRKEYHDMTFKDAMNYTPSPAEIEKAAFGGMETGLGKAELPMEFNAGFNHFPELAKDPQALEAHHDMLSSIFFRTEGDRTSLGMFDDLGIPNSVTPSTASYWEGQAGHGYNVQLLLPENAAGQINPDIAQRLHQGMAALGKSTKQYGGGYYKPAVEATEHTTDLFTIDIGRTLNHAETRDLSNAMNKLGLEGDIIPLNHEKGVDLYYTTFDPNVKLNLGDFQSKVDSTLNSLKWMDDKQPAQMKKSSWRYNGDYFDYERLTGKEYVHGKDNPTEHWEALARNAGGSGQAEGLSLFYAQRVKKAEEAIAKEFGLQNPHERAFVTGDEWGHGIGVGSNPVLADFGHPASGRQARKIQGGLLSVPYGKSVQGTLRDPFLVGGQ